MMKTFAVLFAVAPELAASDGYDYIASTTRYGDMPSTACGGLDTQKLRAGTDYLVVASAQSMQDVFPKGHSCEWQCSDGTCRQVGDCWCGSSSGSQNGTATAAMGCFTCARGRFIKTNPYNGISEDWENYLTKEVKIVVADICPFGSNEQWCPARPGDTNSVGKANHFDFIIPPTGVDNHYFVFTPEPCDSELKSRMAAAASCQGDLPLSSHAPAQFAQEDNSNEQDGRMMLV